MGQNKTKFLETHLNKKTNKTGEFCLIKVLLTTSCAASKPVKTESH